MFRLKMVGAVGFEPTTFRFQAEHANQTALRSDLKMAEVEGYDPSKLLTENQATLPILSTPPLAWAAK